MHHKLDAVLKRLTAIEARCGPCVEEIMRQRRLLNGNGPGPGLTTQMYDHCRQLGSLEKTKWWLLGLSGSTAVGIILLLIQELTK
ncbi:MAG: hypothetical protein ACYTA5_21740 [Planctomycetota bacterium]